MLAWRKNLGKYGLVKSDCEIPMIKDDEVLVKVLATGIYGTDFGIYKGYREVEEGLIPGHEFIGEIVKLGSSVTGYEVGQDMDLKTGASIEPVVVTYSAVKKSIAVYTGQRCSDICSGSHWLIYGTDRQNRRSRSRKNSYGRNGGRPGSSGAGQKKLQC